MVDTTKLRELYREVLSLREKLLKVADDNPDDRELMHASENLKQASRFMDECINK